MEYLRPGGITAAVSSQQPPLRDTGAGEVSSPGDGSLYSIVGGLFDRGKYRFPETGNGRITLF